MKKTKLFQACTLAAAMAAAKHQLRGLNHYSLTAGSGQLGSD